MQLRGMRLRIAPPRLSRSLIIREQLIRKFQSVRECALICVQAPAGYGKTSLLAKLRREWLAAGACAAWLSLDEHDTADASSKGCGSPRTLPSADQRPPPPVRRWCAAPSLAQCSQACSASWRTRQSRRHWYET